MNQMRDFIKKASNVYRTKHYIVVQEIGVEESDVQVNNICSYDTYFARTKARDKEYERTYRDRKHINGRRLRTGMYSRKYID